MIVNRGGQAVHKLAMIVFLFSLFLPDPSPYAPAPKDSKSPWREVGVHARHLYIIATDASGYWW